MNKNIFLLGIIAFLNIGCADSKKTEQTETNANLYYNGDIITMASVTPEYAEVVVEQDGKIVFVGSMKDAEDNYVGAKKINLNGNTMLPGFIDPHSHFEKVSNTMGQLNISPPPVGEVTNIPQILEMLKRYKIEKKIPDGEWIFAWGYDENLLEEGRHPTNKEIDEVLPNNPVYLDHTSGHMGVANGMALKMMNVTSESVNPPGGNIGRYPDSNEPNGLVQETAMYPFVGNMLQILETKAEGFFIATQNYYAENGITTAQDGLINRRKIKFYQKQADAGNMIIDLIALAGYSELEQNLKDSTITFNTYGNRFKVQGTKLIGDGSPQGKTAFFTKPYLTPVDGCEENCTGLPSLTQEAMNKLFITGYKNNNQLFIHCNGDASIDMAIAAHENACKVLEQSLDKDRRTVIIHSQFVRPDQLQKYVDYNILPSFFTNHAYFWGDVHIENLGKERAGFLSPIASADKLGIKYTNHSDATVTPLNPMMTVWSAVNRESRNGVIVGDAERATPYQALKAITIHAAYEHFDENLKGSLEPGKVADFVILEKNPLKVNPEDLKGVKVLKTIKDGKVIFGK
ncbi:amidohydrolase [Winogradskyella alexanderae]|uniref:Amidohydrolase n=1 Tax=Winogradskyella alexanderae TaxID=2877123 RepID=A0ABS7XTH6_9FLAO|nr:amidohydrolase [Winogradskyella alexanderae]MCA0133315.1 amidohydrolase [Winogradskyella alexanderae]